MKLKKPLHGGVILEHLLSLGVDSAHDVLTFRLFHGGVFFLGVLLFRLRLSFPVFCRNQIG